MAHACENGTMEELQIHEVFTGSIGRKTAKGTTDIPTRVPAASYAAAPTGTSHTATTLGTRPCISQLPSLAGDGVYS